MTPRRLSIGVACAALLMAACGSSAAHTSGSASSTASGTGGAAAARTAVVTRTLAQGKTAGVDLDQDCVTKLVAQLSDDDATLLAASSADTSPTATALESPSVSGLSSDAGASTFSTATSVDGSLPTIVAVYVFPSPNKTLTELAPDEYQGILFSCF